ncbi:LANO_0G03532g1_1 [Lachancea nothofagi CBS 11611]|uniref:Protein SOP4 n=1 Tax=Lachancea nothofagi CBS 11611 TaxID=1266666 RepID=A0A1G4KFJ2_9SACH|nr:LANO_0G03532g1_1 [Lachancea nothofagi CBS 11611]
MLVSIVCLFLAMCATSFGATIKGKLDLSPFNVSRKDAINSNFKLLQVGDLGDQLYISNTRIRDFDGNFEFQHVPEPQDANSTVYFVLQSSSLDYNLKPNRILIRLDRGAQDANGIVTRAFKNVFGKENFPSPEILHPEELEEIDTKPYISITLVNKAPLRTYIQERSVSMFESGPLASILSSKYKLAAVITGVMTLLFSLFIGKLDIEGANAIKDDKILQQQTVKQTDQKEVQKELKNIKKRLECFKTTKPHEFYTKM